MLITFCNLPLILLLAGISMLVVANGQIFKMWRTPVDLNGMDGMEIQLLALLALLSSKVLNVEDLTLATVGTLVLLGHIWQEN